MPCLPSLFDSVLGIEIGPNAATWKQTPLFRVSHVRQNTANDLVHEVVVLHIPGRLLRASGHYRESHWLQSARLNGNNNRWSSQWINCDGVAYQELNVVFKKQFAKV